MSTEENNFESRILYSQEAFVDENVKVKSSVCASTYTFKGSLTPITVRCRLTIVYSETDNQIDPKGGTIEKWSDQGWQVVDEYFDMFLAFEDADEALDYLLQMFKCFILGAQMNLIPNTKPFPPDPPDEPGKKPEIRVLNFAKERAKATQNKSKKSTGDADDSSPDFDWI